MPEVTQIQQLVTPLSDNPQTILNKRNNNQETTNGREMSKDTVSADLDSRGTRANKQPNRNDNNNIRFNRVGNSIQPVLQFASLLPNSIQGTGIARRIGAPRTSEGVLVTEIVARGAADLRHGVSGGRGEEQV